jgi:hypothetical protein
VALAICGAAAATAFWFTAKLIKVPGKEVGVTRHCGVKALRPELSKSSSTDP